MQGTCNLTETIEYGVDELSDSDQLGVDECEIDHITLLVALCVRKLSKVCMSSETMVPKGLTSV
jgi:hypothetical protein